MAVEVKKDPRVWYLAIVIVICTMGAVYTGHATFREAIAFISGALALPALWGSNEDDVNHRITLVPPEPGPATVTVNVDNTPEAMKEAGQHDES